MFKNLSTSTKLIILCGMFILSIGVTTHSLVAEHRIAIDFARRELLGNRYLAILRNVYAAILSERPIDSTTASAAAAPEKVLSALAAEQESVEGKFQTEELADSLLATMRELLARRAQNGPTDTLVLEALNKARKLATRVADDSNLTLDPDLDTYYLQNIVANHLPTLLGQLGEAHVLFHDRPQPGTGTDGSLRFVLDGLLRSTTDAIAEDLSAAYRGNVDGRLKHEVDNWFLIMSRSARAYLGALNAARFDNEARGLIVSSDTASLDGLYGRAVGDGLFAWAGAEIELDRLLHHRIDNLLAKLRRSLLLTGALAALSIVVAVMTHRRIVGPLERLESIAETVRETKNYTLRAESDSNDEIGHLAVVFNDMLAELAAARDREITEQAELARADRLMTIGAMTASIAHEINQPLAAIVTNSNAGLRWLANASPDLDEARAALKRIAKDGHRASEVIGSIRAMFKKEAQHKGLYDINDIVQEVLGLVQGEIKKQKVTVRTELASDLPPVLADRVQVQQVVLNLMNNAIDAMSPITDRAHVLRVRSAIHDGNGVSLSVEDSGVGIDPKNAERIFDAFFTTKANGTGLGLAICRSIIEAHGGRLAAAPAQPHGSVFEVVLPAGVATADEAA
jgi:signal transduction histidine kinase